MDPHSPPPSSPTSGGSLRQLKTHALAQLDATLARALGDEKNAIAAAARLTAEIEGKMQSDLAQMDQKCLHTYGVFAVGGRHRRRLVLRDVAELDGRPPESTTGDFTEALQRASARLNDAVRENDSHPDVREDLASLHRLLRRVQKISEHNARLGGSGTSDDPLTLPYGGAVHVTGPITLGFNGVSPDQLTLKRDGTRVRIFQKNAPAP